MPSASPVMPKLKRRAPEFTSVPTRPSSKPSTTIAIALRSDPRADRFEKRSARQNNRRDQAADHEREIFRRAELQRYRRERRRGKRDQEGRGATGEERTECGDAQRRSGAYLPRHLVAVGGGDDRRRLARDVDQDRRGRAAVLGAVIDAGEQDQRRFRLQRERDRQQHGDGGDRTYAGQHADDGAEQNADEAVSDVLDRQRDGKSQAEIGDHVHRRLEARPDIEWEAER